MPIIGSNILLAWRNQIDDAALSASSEVLPADNLADYRPAVVWRSDPLTDDPAPFVQAQFAGPRAITTMILWNHNLTVSARLRLRCWADAAGAAPVYDSGSIPAWETVQGAGEGGAGEGGAGGAPLTDDQAAARPGRLVTLPSQVSATVVRLDLVDPGNPDGYVQFGRWFVGAAYQPSINFGYGATLDWKDPGDALRTDLGSLRFRRRPKYREMTLGWDGLPQGEALTVWDDIARVLGTTRDLFAVLTPSATPGLRGRVTLYCAAVRNGPLGFASFQRFSKKSFVLQEIL